MGNHVKKLRRINHINTSSIYTPATAPANCKSSYLFITAGAPGTPSSSSCVGLGEVTAHKGSESGYPLKSPPFSLVLIPVNSIHSKESKWLRLNCIAFKLHLQGTRNTRFGGYLLGMINKGIQSVLGRWGQKIPTVVNNFSVSLLFPR